MQAFEAIAEQRIEEAARRGDFDDLPGSGRPLELEADYYDRLVERLA